MLTLAIAAATLTTAPAKSIQVMVVGTFHMAGGRDMVNPSVKEILGDKRQQEMLLLVDGLSKFKPTIVAIERPFGSIESSQKLKDYVAGSYVLTKNEIDQVAMRIAAKAKLHELVGIDWKKDLDIMGVLDHSEKTGQGHIKKSLMELMEKEIIPSFAKMESQTLLEIFRDNNSPAFDDKSHEVYMSLAQVGQGEDYKGADMVSDWYERNLKIAVNVRRVSKPGDRVFVLIGSGHRKLLCHFLSEMAEIEVISPLQYLK